MADHIAITQHDVEIQANLDRWNAKPLLRKIYKDFHRQIAEHVLPSDHGLTVELGSGIGNIKEVIPHCIRTDLFPNPWIDRTENAYTLSFSDNTVANVILFDVFHHLRYPGTALKELSRVLVPGGRVVIFDPCMSLLGLCVYGLGHHEPIAVFDPIAWEAPAAWDVADDSYYAAQGNAYRVFFSHPDKYPLGNMNVVVKKRFSAISYVASGGYGKSQLYPDALYPYMKTVDRLVDFLPLLFATRLLVVLEKKIPS